MMLKWRFFRKITKIVNRVGSLPSASVRDANKFQLWAKQVAKNFNTFFKGFFFPKKQKCQRPAQCKSGPGLIALCDGSHYFLYSHKYTFKNIVATF